MKEMKKHDFLFSHPAIKIVNAANMEIATTSTGKCSTINTVFYFPPLFILFFFHHRNGATKVYLHCFIPRKRYAKQPLFTACHYAPRSLSSSIISDSSIVPYSSYINMTKARATAVVATPTTIAVRISTCGNGFT